MTGRTHPARSGKDFQAERARLFVSAAAVAEQLWAHAAFREIDEVTFALPFTFDHEDYVQILTDIATRLGPALGWQPAAA